MAPTIESDENDLILKVIADVEHNLNCDFSLKTEQKSAFHAICQYQQTHSKKVQVHCIIVCCSSSTELIKHTILFLNILTTQQT